MKTWKLTVRSLLLIVMLVCFCGNMSHAFEQQEDSLILWQSADEQDQDDAEKEYQWRNGWCYCELSDGTLELTGYDENAVSLTKEGAMTIPGTLDGKRVSLVSAEFSGNLKLVTVGFESGITKITGNFSRCNNLVRIVFPETLKELGVATLYGCPSLKEAVLPEGLEKMGDCVFSGCTAMESIWIPESLTRIESYTFEKCSSLKRVVIPDSVTDVFYCAFKECTALEEVYLPSSLNWLDPHTFLETGNAGEKIKVILPSLIAKPKQSWTTIENLDHLCFYVEKDSEMEAYLEQFQNLDIRTYVRDEAFELARAQAAGSIEVEGDRQTEELL